MKYYPSVTEIDTMLEGVISAASRRSIIFHEFFKNLKSSGFRFIELKNNQLWYFDEKMILHAPTAKGGNTRTNVQEYISPFLLDHIYNNTNPFSRIDNSTASYWMYSFISVGNLYHETKVLKTHLFRHLLAKQMHQSGKTTQEIMAFFGEIDQKNMENYIYSDIYYNT